MEPRLYQGQAPAGVRCAPSLDRAEPPRSSSKWQGVTGRQVPILHILRGSGSGTYFQRAAHEFCGRGGKSDFVALGRSAQRVITRFLIPF